MYVTVYLHHLCNPRDVPAQVRPEQRGTLTTLGERLTTRLDTGYTLLLCQQRGPMRKEAFIESSDPEEWVREREEARI